MPPVSWSTVYGEENITTDLKRTVMNSFEVETGKTCFASMSEAEAIHVDSASN